jgi:hypothetical protein
MASELIAHLERLTTKLARGDDFIYLGYLNSLTQN